MIANPPYLGEKGNKEKFHQVKKGFIKNWYLSKMDLFYLFFHLSIDFAKENGIIIFITTNYFITADGALKLRRDFSERTNPLKFINFNEFKIFDSALGQHNIISILQKGKSKYECFIADVNSLGIYNKKKLDSILRGVDNDTKYFNSDSIFDGDKFYLRISSSNTDDKFLILEKIKLNKKNLNSFVNINSGCDITLGKVTAKHIEKFPNYNFTKDEGIFIINQKQKSSIGLNNNEEKKVKPFIKSSDISNYIYELSDDELLYIDWNENPKEIPNIIEHLSKFKSIAEDQSNRYNENTWPWYSIHRPREIEIFESQDKIIVPYRAKKNIFAYSSSPVFSSRDVFFLTPKKDSNKNILRNLVPILNSKLIYFWLYHRGKRKGDTLELYGTPLSEIPIVNPEGNIFGLLTGYMICLLGLKKNINEFVPNSHIIENLEEIIDAMVLELYFPNEFAAAGIEFLKYVERYFKSIDGLDNEQQKEQIYIAYQKSSDENNEIRSNIKSMKIKLHDLLTPILSV